MSFSPKPPRFKAPSDIGGGGFKPYAAGSKSYGMGMRSAPNVGGVQSASAAAGYGQRDTAAAARRNALIKRAGM